MGMSQFKYNSDVSVRGPRESARSDIMDARELYGSKVSLIVTDQCNISCAHCLPECTGAENKKLDIDIVLRLIDEALSQGLKTICFTGGEPFLKFDTLVAGIKYASELGMETTVISNGYWAKTVDKAVDKLSQLEGLTKLGLSTDVFHQAFVPIEKIVNGIRAAQKLGIYCAIRLTHLNDPDQEIAELQTQLDSVRGLYDLEHQPVQPLGRAETEIPYDKIFAYDVSLACCRSADVHAVNAAGDLTACCGATGEWSEDHPLKFGNIKNNSLSNLLNDANQNPILHAVRLWGSAGLLKLALEEAERREIHISPPKIQNLCELCRLVNTSEPYVSLLVDAVKREEVVRKIAVARLIELGEPDMMY